jgi:hypothetical protein
MPILKTAASHKSKALSVRIPVELAAELDDIREMAQARGLVFDTSEQVTRALRVALKQAKDELAGQTTAPATHSPRHAIDMNAAN